MWFLVSLSFVSEPLSSAEYSLSYATNPNQEPLESIPEEATYTSSPFPVYRRTTLFTLSQDGASHAPYPTPRGILKVMSDQDSTDSLVSAGAVPQSPLDRGSAAEDAGPTGRDALGKQVRFGPALGQGEPQPGEHSLLDVDHVVGSPSAENNNDGGTAAMCRPLLRQVAVGSQEIHVLKPEVSAQQVPGGKSFLQTNVPSNELLINYNLKQMQLESITSQNHTKNTNLFQGFLLQWLLPTYYLFYFFGLFFCMNYN